MPAAAGRAVRRLHAHNVREKEANSVWEGESDNRARHTLDVFGLRTHSNIAGLPILPPHTVQFLQPAIRCVHVTYSNAGTWQ